MDDPGDFVTDYDVSFAAMRELGWDVETVPWRDANADWNRFDAVYICTPWDYPDDPALFMRVLEEIDGSAAQLINPLSLVRWTLEKTYLRDLAGRGAPVVPSRWFDSIDAGSIPDWFTTLGADEIVVKPVIGANAQDTFVLMQPLPQPRLVELSRLFAGRPYFVQPFMPHIRDEGEYSLFFFGGEYSHAILKTPASGDFRTQEEHGADIRSVTATPRQIRTASEILDLVTPPPAYVRVDLVRDRDENFLLMELELIEPSLYLRTDPGSAERFARAFDACYRQGAKPVTT